MVEGAADEHRAKRRSAKGRNMVVMIRGESCAIRNGERLRRRGTGGRVLPLSPPAFMPYRALLLFCLLTRATALAGAVPPAALPAGAPAALGAAEPAPGAADAALPAAEERAVAAQRAPPLGALGGPGSDVPVVQPPPLRHDAWASPPLEPRVALGGAPIAPRSGAAPAPGRPPLLGAPEPPHGAPLMPYMGGSAAAPGTVAPLHPAVTGDAAEGGEPRNGPHLLAHPSAPAPPLQPFGSWAPRAGAPPPSRELVPLGATVHATPPQPGPETGGTPHPPLPHPRAPGSLSDTSRYCAPWLQQPSGDTAVRKVAFMPGANAPPSHTRPSGPAPPRAVPGPAGDAPLSPLPHLRVPGPEFGPTFDSVNPSSGVAPQFGSAPLSAPGSSSGRTYFSQPPNFGVLGSAPKLGIQGLNAIPFPSPPRYGSGKDTWPNGSPFPIFDAPLSPSGAEEPSGAPIPLLQLPFSTTAPEVFAGGEGAVGAMSPPPPSAKDARIARRVTSSHPVSWRQYGYNALHNGASPYLVPLSLSTLWTWNSGRNLAFDISPVLSEEANILVVPTDSGLFSLNLSTGAVVGNHPLYSFGGTVTGQPLAPALSSDGLTVFFCGNQLSALFAAHTANLETVWISPLSVNAQCSSHLTIGPGDILYFGTTVGDVVSFFPNGTQSTTYTLISSHPSAALAAPAISSGVLYAARGCMVGAFSIAQAPSSFTQTPIWVYSGGCWGVTSLTLSEPYNTLYAFSPWQMIAGIFASNGTLRGSTTAATFVGVGVADDIVVVTHGNKYIYGHSGALDLLWMTWTNEQNQGIPSISANGFVLSINNFGGLNALKIADGSWVWQYVLHCYSRAAVVFSSTGVVIAINGCGTVWALFGSICAAGTYNSWSGPLSAGRCSPCVAGSFCTGGGAATMQACPPGFFCPEASITPTPCPPGTFSGAEGGLSNSSCTACPAGTWSAASGATSISFCAPCAADVVNPVAGASSPRLCGSGRLTYGFPYIEYPFVHLFDHSLMLTSALSPNKGALHLMVGSPLVTLVSINISGTTFEETSRVVSSPQWDAGVYMGSYGIKMCISDDERKLLVAWDAGDMRSVVFDNGAVPSNYFDVFGFFNWAGVVSFTCGGLDRRVAPPAPVAYYQFWGDSQGIGKMSPTLREWLGGSPPVDHWGFSNLVYAPFVGGALFGMHTGWFGSISFGTSFFRVNATTMQVEATGSTVHMWSQYVWHEPGQCLILGSTLTPCDAAATMDPFSLAASPLSCVATKGTLASLVPAIDSAGRLYYITKAGVVLQRFFNATGQLAPTSALFLPSDFNTFVSMQSARLFFSDNQLFGTAAISSTASAVLRLLPRCPAGQTSTANGGCALCPAGTASNASSYFCSFCPPGTFSPSGAITCSSCAAGTFSGSGASTCTTCAAGDFSAAGALSCAFSASTCPAGTYASAPASCLPCAAGMRRLGGAAPCTSCDPGTFSLAGASLCMNCTAGTFSSAVGASSCTPCAAGTYSTEGAATCTACALGTYSSTIGANSASFCLTCTAGTFSSSTGANTSAACRSCPVGTFSIAGASSCVFTSSTCPAGTFANATSACAPCPAGTYSSLPGASSSAQCTPCMAGTYSPPTSAASSAPCVPCYPVTACAVPGLSAQPPCYWNVSTVAGSGEWGRMDGQGVVAQFASPHGVAVGASLTFVIDLASSTLRTISPSGFVSTLAGTGYAGYADGQGTNAAFNEPRFIAASSSMVYVADYRNHRVRLVNYSGFVSTLAGDGSFGWLDGAGTNARFAGPHGLTLSSTSVFITEIDGHRVRQVTFGGVVTTFAGSGTPGAYNARGTSASFRHPLGISLAPSGMLYVADWDNRLIRAISPSADVTTLAGTGAASLTNGPGNVASFVRPLNVFADSTSVFVLDANALRMVSLLPGSEGYVSTVAGGEGWGYANGFGTTALFSHPTAASASPSGEMFVSEYNNNRIRHLTCVPCPASFYCHFGAPMRCPAGSYCPLRSPSDNLTPCPAGTWSTAMGAASDATCANCPAGKFSARLGSTSCAACPAGTYSAVSGANSSRDCLPCATATYSPSGASACVYTASTCPVGTYASAPAACSACSPATACTIPGLSAQPRCFWNVSTLAGSGAAWWADGQGTAAMFNDPHGVTFDQFSSTLYVGDHGGNRVRRLSPAGLVTTFAGSGGSWFVDGLGTAAAISGPVGLSTDSAGVVYVAECVGNRVRRIFPSGEVSTLAGSGVAGGIDGVGSAAQLHCPTDITLDSHGATGYIVEQLGHRIRSIALSTASVLTLAGSGVAGSADGTGVAAQFYYPTGAVWHPSGMLYVAGSWEHRIRQINTSSAAVTTLAGNGFAGGLNGVGTAATFSVPRGVALDTTFSTLYVAEDDGHRIRSIDLSTSLVKTIAGSGVAAFGDAFGVLSHFFRPVMVTSSPQGVLYTAERGNNRIRQLTCVACPAAYDCSSGTPVICPAGFFCPPPSNNATACPAGTWSNARGATSNTCTRCGAGTYSTFVGASVPSTCTPCPAGTYSTSTGAASLSECAPCAAGSYSAAGANSCSFTASTCPVGTYASAPASCAACSPATACTMVGLSAQPPCFWNVSTLAGSGAAAFADGVGEGASFHHPRGLSFNAGGSLIVADQTNNRIRYVTLAGVVSTIAGDGAAGSFDGTGTGAFFNNPHGTATDANDSVFVAGYYEHRVRMVTPGGVVSTLAGSTAGFAEGTGLGALFYQPRGVAVGASGLVFVADSGNHRIRSVTPAGVVSTFAGSAAGFADGIGTNAQFAYPLGVAVDAGGFVFVAEFDNNCVRKVTPSGAVSLLAGNPLIGGGYSDGTGTNALFFGLHGISIESSGALVIADSANNLIRKISPGGLVTTLAGSTFGAFADGIGTSASFNYPCGVLAHPSGTIFVGDTSNHRIRALTCTPCPASYYCSSGAPLLCPAGSFCPLSSADPIPCPAGTYATATGASTSATCLACPCLSSCSQPGLAAAPTCSAAATFSSSPTGSASSTATASAAATRSPASTGSASSSAAGTLTSSASPSSSPRLPPGAPCAPSAPHACAAGACRAGFCCSAAAIALGCAACLPGTGACVHFSPGEPCASNAACGTNLCAGGCCCASSALRAPGCTACQCWANASTTALTAGACVAGGDGGAAAAAAAVSYHTHHYAGATVVVGSCAAPPPRCHACEAFDASAQVDGLFILPSAHPLNPTPGVDLAVGLPGACATLAGAAAAQGVPPAEVAAMLPCLAHPAFLLIDGANYAVLGPAAPLKLAALPEGCGAG
jgi:sugar lactone lactonase YvrE